MEIWEPKLPGTLWATLCLLQESFTFTFVFVVPSNLHPITLKLYLNTGMADTPIAVVPSLTFKTDFSIILNFLVYSVYSLSFIC